MTGARNSPSQQLELLSGSGSVKRDTMETIDSMDYSPDIIPKDGGETTCVTTIIYRWHVFEELPQAEINGA